MGAIGVIGAGIMGLTAAKQILKAGHKLWAYDLSLEAQERAQKIGVQISKTPANIAERADVVLMFLPGPKEVEICVAGPEGLLSNSHSEMIIVDLSTVDPGISQRMAELTRQEGIDYLDAPVLGRPGSIGNWMLPVGGNADALSRCRSILELLAAKIVHIGDSGSGNKVKLLNQLMFGAINAMTAEMMAIAEKVGIPPRLLYDTITASQAGTVSNLFKELGRRIADENYDDATFTVDLLIKDVMLGVQMAKEHKAPPILARTVEFINEMARAQGLGDKDTSIMWTSFRKIWEQ